jgi:putative ATP-dependent endonuclease of OLD family
MTVDSGKDNSADDLRNISIKIKNYMCFGETPQGFESIKPINIIIGRNNSGKSRLLDMLQFATNIKRLENQRRDGKDSEIIISLPLIEPELRSVFSDTMYSNNSQESHWDFGKKHIGNKITFSFNGSGRKYIRLDPPFDENFGRDINGKANELAGKVRNPLQGKTFGKINAERNIVPEPLDRNRVVTEDGVGATNIMRIFWHHVDYLTKSANTKLLKDLNEIVFPDICFEEINLKEFDNGNWEIFLKEKGKGIISLSDSGSGLKTILLVLINILLVPEREGKSLDKYIFVFEELENNLHPAHIPHFNFLN